MRKRTIVPNQPQGETRRAPAVRIIPGASNTAACPHIRNRDLASSIPANSLVGPRQTIVDVIRAGNCLREEMPACSERAVAVRKTARTQSPLDRQPLSRTRGLRSDTMGPAGARARLKLIAARVSRWPFAARPVRPQGSAQLILRTSPQAAYLPQLLSLRRRHGSSQADSCTADLWVRRHQGPTYRRPLNVLSRRRKGV